MLQSIVIVRIHKSTRVCVCNNRNLSSGRAWVVNCSKSWYNNCRPFRHFLFVFSVIARVCVCVGLILRMVASAERSAAITWNNQGTSRHFLSLPLILFLSFSLYFFFVTCFESLSPCFLLQFPETVETTRSDAHDFIFETTVRMHARVMQSLTMFCSERRKLNTRAVSETLRVAIVRDCIRVAMSAQRFEHFEALAGCSIYHSYSSSCLSTDATYEGVSRSFRTRSINKQQQE
jgi:hypothetical protein